LPGVQRVELLAELGHRSPAIAVEHEVAEHHPLTAGQLAALELGELLVERLVDFRMVHV
jgi:hypothetical protein